MNSLNRVVLWLGTGFVCGLSRSADSYNVPLCKGTTYTDTEGQIVMIKRGLERMTIQACTVANGTDVQTLNSSLFSNLMENVIKLDVINTNWTLFPKFYMLEEVRFLNVHLIGGWGDCSKLTELEMYNGDVSHKIPNWLSKCTNLRSLTIYNTSASQLKWFLQSAPLIRTLDVGCAYDLKDILQDPLFTNRSHQQLKIIQIASASPCKDGIDLVIKTYECGNRHDSYGKTEWTTISAALIWQLSLLPVLEKIKLCIPEFDLCAPGNITPVTFASLRRLVVSRGVTIPHLCFRKKLIMHMLEELVFYRAEINLIEVGELISVLRSRPQERKADLYVHAWSDVQIKLDREDYLTLSNITKTRNQSILLHLYSNSQKCSGDTFWFVRALRMNLITIAYNGIIKCKNGTSVLELSYYRTECKRVACDSPCVCCHLGPEDEFFADCRDADLTALPKELLLLSNLTVLLAPNNSITELPEALPNNLKLLDLSGNRIRHLNGSAALFAVKTRRWRLSHNPLVCTCDNEPLLDMLQNNQIEDFESIECNNKIGLFKALPEVCASRNVNISLENEKKSKENEMEHANKRERVLHVVVATLTVLAVTALVIGIALYYRKLIKIFLFSRGWCLCCIKKEFKEEDRRYDVFLSFCHEDADLVLNELLPKLDQEYTVCMHLRDWTPGEMIPENIRQSVKESRKSMIILSKNFAKSLWGVMEFQTAYAVSLKEGCNRVLMVVLDDVLESPDLNKDIRQYVRFNTYVRWDDPWFWSKLRYALPNQIRLQENPQQEQPERSFPALGEIVVTSNAVALIEDPSLRLASTGEERH